SSQSHRDRGLGGQGRGLDVGLPSARGRSDWDLLAIAAGILADDVARRSIRAHGGSPGAGGGQAPGLASPGAGRCAAGPARVRQPSVAARAWILRIYLESASARVDHLAERTAGVALSLEPAWRSN